MFTFVLNIALILITGATQKALAAAEALGKPAVTPAAQRYCTWAVVFFILTSAFLLCAAIGFTSAPQNVLNEIVGSTGIVCVHVCVFCGLRYGVLNHVEDDGAVA